MRQHDLSLWIIPFTGKKHSSSQIEEFIIDRIKSRSVQPSEDIPSHRILARLNKVNRNTALRAYTKLISTGWLTHNRGSKSLVADPPPSDNSARKLFSMPETIPFNLALNSQRQQYFQPAMELNFVSLGVPIIDKAYCPIKLLAKYARKYSQAKFPSNPQQRSTPEGRLTLQNAILAHLNIRGFNISTNHLMVVRGRSEYLRSLFKVLSSGNEIIVNTAPSDILIGLILKECGLRMIALELAGGDFLLRLEQLIQNSNIKALYLRSHCSFPHCKSLDDATCVKLISLAKKYNFYILEEDDDHEFWWGKQPLKPLAQYDHAGYVIYCAALSRLSPYMQNLRTVVAPAQMISTMKFIPDSALGYIDPTEEWAITQLLLNSELLSFSRQVRLSKQKDLKKLHEILQHQIGEFISYELPQSGTGLWICFPKKINLKDALDIVKSDGINVRYHPEMQQLAPIVHHIYLDFSKFEETECSRAAMKLRTLMQKLPR